MRELLSDFDQSTQSLLREENELKSLFYQQYHDLQHRITANARADNFDLDKIKEQLALLKGNLPENGMQRTGISEAAIMLGETLLEMTFFEKSHTVKVTDFIEGLDRRRVLEAICGGNGGRLDEGMIEDIMRRMVSVQRKTAERIFQKYNLKTEKMGACTQTDPLVEQVNEDLDGVVRKCKRKKRDLKDELQNHIKKTNLLDAEFQLLSKKYTQLSEQHRAAMKENKELDFKNTQLTGERKELLIFKEQYERRFSEMSQNHSSILTSLIEATEKATFLSKDN